MTQSVIHSHMNGRLATKRGALKVKADTEVSFADLENIGINLRAMDAALIGGGSGGVPGYISSQPLETWLPGTLRAITQVRKIDEIAGVTTVGRWEDEAIKVKLEEPMGQARLYGDNANIPFADFRTTVEARGMVRFELGFTVGKLEQARTGANGIDAAASKRRAVQEALDVSRNLVGFFGYNSPDSNVYGFLNDPNLPGYTGSQNWQSASYAQLVTEFTAMVEQIETQSGGRVNGEDAKMQLTLPTGYRSIFNKDNGQGYTFGEWLKENYPNVRIVAAPELVGANASVDVAYLFVENIGDIDDSDVEGSSLIQAVPTRYEVLGSEQRIKAYIEDATSATAGVFVTRPWAFARRNIS